MRAAINGLSAAALTSVLMNSLQSMMPAMELIDAIGRPQGAGQKHQYRSKSDPHQGSQECARRLLQVRKLEVRGRDWTGRAV